MKGSVMIIQIRKTINYLMYSFPLIHLSSFLTSYIFSSDIYILASKSDVVERCHNEKETIRK